MRVDEAIGGEKFEDGARVRGRKVAMAGGEGIAERGAGCCRDSGHFGGVGGVLMMMRE